MSQKRIDWENDKAKIIDMLNGGVLLEEIGKLYGVSKQRIKQKLKHLNISISPKRSRYNQRLEKLGITDWEGDPIRTAQKDKFLKKRYGASALKIQFDITFTDIEWPERCPVFDVAIDYFAKGNEPNSASFDRTNPKLGYVKGNVKIISWRANRIKNDATLADLKRIVSYLENL